MEFSAGQQNVPGPKPMEPDESLRSQLLAGLEQAEQEVESNRQSVNYHDHERERWARIAAAHRAALEVLDPPKTAEMPPPDFNQQIQAAQQPRGFAG